MTDFEIQLEETPSKRSPIATFYLNVENKRKKRCLCDTTVSKGTLVYTVLDVAHLIDTLCLEPGRVNPYLNVFQFLAGKNGHLLLSVAELGTSGIF